MGLLIKYVKHCVCTLQTVNFTLHTQLYCPLNICVQFIEHFLMCEMLNFVISIDSYASAWAAMQLIVSD